MYFFVCFGTLFLFNWIVSLEMLSVLLLRVKNLYWYLVTLFKIYTNYKSLLLNATVLGCFRCCFFVFIVMICDFFDEISNERWLCFDVRRICFCVRSICFCERWICFDVRRICFCVRRLCFDVRWICLLYNCEFRVTNCEMWLWIVNCE